MTTTKDSQHAGGDVSKLGKPKFNDLSSFSLKMATFGYPFRDKAVSLYPFSAADFEHTCTWLKSGRPWWWIQCFSSFSPAPRTYSTVQKWQVWHETKNGPGFWECYISGCILMFRFMRQQRHQHLFFFEWHIWNGYELTCFWSWHKTQSSYSHQQLELVGACSWHAAHVTNQHLYVSKKSPCRNSSAQMFLAGSNHLK